MNHSLSQQNLDLTATSMNDEAYLFPVSFSQQRQWVLNQLEGQSATYTIASARSLQGTLHLSALEQTLQTLVQRHETLRTTFRVIDHAPMQVIRPSLTLSVPKIDLTQLSPENQSDQVQSLIQEFAQHIFDLQTGPLIRVSLVQVSAQKHILLLAIHHIIADGWSMQVFWQEFAALYQAFCQKQPSPLTDLAIQYADYTLWQQEWLQGKVFATQLVYWKQQLGGELPILQLPIDRPRPLVQTYHGSHQTITISAETTQSLKSLSQTANATLFMTLLAAFQTLLHRYSGQTDIIVGTPIAGRNPVETEPLIGLFANLLALRTDLGGNPTFRQLLQRVREIALGAYSHADIPFEKLIEELRPQRDSSRFPLFQVAFSLENFFSSKVELPGLAIETLPVPHQVAKLDLILVLQDTAEGLLTKLEYNTDLFDDATIVRMLGHWQVLLNSIVSNPDQAIGQLPLLTEFERHQILVEWNDTATDHPKNQCAHQLFEAQVERTPEAIAVVAESQQLTYRELNAKVNQLAQYLQKQGVGPETVVGIALERSLEMIVGVIGVLKAGGAYLPLDPALPPSRLSYMLKDTDTRVLLSQTSWRDQFSEFEGHWVDLIADWPMIAQENPNNLDNTATSQNLAYIIYTSGSTGYPKGVMVEHRSLSGFAAPARLQAYHVNGDSRVLLFGSLSFSSSLSEIFMTLLVGATLYITSQQSLLSGPELASVLRDYAITHIKITPSVLSAMPNGDFPALSVITVMGEPTAFDILRRWLPNRTVLSSYGATEVSVSSTCIECREENKQPSIGRPVSNTKIYLLDAHLQPVPIHVPGEIYITGIGLARGYLNQPELTAERFLPDPFAPRPRTLMYKTGDLAYYLPDGQIVYLGRMDDQVQIRGMRIELGEVQAAIKQYPLIEDAVVIAREDQPGKKYLAAYLVPNQHQVPFLDDLRQFLKQKLPNYMIPSAFVPLEAIPLTLNGKVDRQALPTPDWQQQSSAAFVAPRNLIEQQLAEIWKTILWREQPVSIHDNFFDLGRHSLLAFHLVSEIEKAFSIKLPLASLFQLGTIAELAEIISNPDHQTIEKLSPVLQSPRQILFISDSDHQPISEKEYTERYLDLDKRNITQVPSQLEPEIHRKLLAFTAAWKGQRVTPDSLIVGLNSQGTQPPLFWCFQGFRELSQMAKYIGDDQPVYGMRSGHLIMPYTDETIQALAAHYVQEILRIQPTGTYRLGGNCQAGKIMFTVAQQLQQQGKTVALLCLLEAFIPKPYFGPVALFFGQESDRFNPYKRFSEPALGYRKYYRGGFSITIVSGGHGQYFDEPNIQVLTQELQKVLNSTNTDEYALLTSSAYQAQLSTISVLSLSQGEAHTLAVTVKNMSPVTWLATEKSGIFLANHWLDEKGNVVRWLDSRAVIDRNLAPNESIQLDLTVTAPTELGQYQLELDLVEEGITWFENKGSKSSVVQVEISELNEIQGEALQKFEYLQQDGNLNQHISVSSSRAVNLSIVEDVQSLQMGHDRFMKGDHAGAVAHYEQAIQQNPGQPAELYLNLGKALSRMGRATEAISYCQTAIQLAPDFAQAYEQLGTIQKQQGDLDGAIASYQRAIELQPNQPLVVYKRLGDLLYNTGEIKAAILVYQEILSLHPQNQVIRHRICLLTAQSPSSKNE